MTEYNYTKLHQWNKYKKIVLEYYLKTETKKYEINDYDLEDHLNHYVSNINNWDEEIPLILTIFAYHLYNTLIENNVSFERYLDHVGIHVDSYTSSQYGNFPDKTIAKFTSEKIQGKLEAYIDRIGKSARGKADEITDSLKIGHFSCYLYSLILYKDAQLLP